MDWDAYRSDLTANVGKLGKGQKELLKGYQALEKASAATQHLDAKTRELIALAVAVTTRCDGCIAVHGKAAAEAGASREEIAEALGVAIALNAGAALVYSSRAIDAATQAGAG
jgi:AhpD family alkylhydroperoxidase